MPENQAQAQFLYLAILMEILTIDRDYNWAIDKTKEIFKLWDQFWSQIFSKWKTPKDIPEFVNKYEPIIVSSSFAILLIH